MLHKTQRKLPKTTIEDLTQSCELMSKYSGQPAGEIFQRYLDLIDKYAEYFFNAPWPAKYDFTKATTFTEEDMQFIMGNIGEFNVQEAGDRFDLICLKKTVSLEGSPGYWGLFWAHQALEAKLEQSSAENSDDAAKQN